MEGIINAPTSSHAQNAGTIQTGQQQQGIENGSDGQMMTSTPIIKSEVNKVETIVTMDPNGTGEIPMSTPIIKTGKRSKNVSGAESKYFYQIIEQQTNCSIIYTKE